MIRGCLFALLLYAAIAVGYFFWLDTVFERPESYYGAAGLGFVVFLCIGALMNARTAWQDWSLAAAARAHSPPRDGRLFAACGTIEPVDQPLLAPFSGAACCLVEYDLKQESNSSSSSEDDTKTGSDLAGFLMTPSEIHTPSGRFKLLGFPILEEGHSYTLKSYTAARRARDFVSRTQFEDISGLRLLSAFGAIQDAWTDDDGRVEKNLQLKKVDPQALFPDDLEAVWQEIHGEQPVDDRGAEEHAVQDDDEEDFDDEDDLDDDSDDDGTPLPNIPIPTLKENRISPGDQVCVIGKYDELTRGIRPVGAGMKAIRLIRGSVETLEGKSRGSLWSHLIGGVVFLLLAHGITYVVMQLYLHSADTIRKRTHLAFQAAEKGEIEPIERLVKRGLSIDVRDSENRTLLMVTREVDVARWLIAHQIDVNAVDKRGHTAISHFAMRNQRELVELLIAAGANLNVRDEAARTALEAAERANYPEIAELLRGAGADDHLITAKNGAALPEDGGPQLAAAQQYVRAIFARDAASLAEVLINPYREVDDALWSGWQNEIFEPFEKFEGHERGDAATLNVYGKSVPFNSAPARMEFLLKRIDGKWKVADKRLYIN